MQPMQAEQATFLLNAVFLPALKNEQRVTRKIIEAVPTDRGDYRPDPVSKTAVELAWHIAASENRFLEGIAAGEFDFSGPGRPDSVRTSADVATWYARSCDASLQKLTQMSGEQLVKTIDFRGILQFPAVVYLQLALNHSIHHRGQLSVYLRPMGAKVPSIYGESYDDAQVRKAAQA
jgi:uncharacterized damage-inducible protein DinB